MVVRAYTKGFYSFDCDENKTTFSFQAQKAEQPSAVHWSCAKNLSRCAAPAIGATGKT